MTQQTLNGNNYSDEPGVGRSLVAGGHRLWFMALIVDFFAEIRSRIAQMNAGFNSTSTSSLAVSTGAKTATIGTGLAYVTGSLIRFSRTSASATLIDGRVDTYNSGTGALTFTATSVSGTGTFTDWTVSQGGIAGPQGPTGPTGSTGATGATGAQGPQGAAGQPFNWQVITAGQTAATRTAYACNTSGGAFTLTLPASPAVGDQIRVLDAAGTFNTGALTIARNAQNIMGLAEDMIVDTQNGAFELVFVDSTRGWRIA